MSFSITVRRLQARQAEFDAIRLQEDTGSGKATRMIIQVSMMIIWSGGYFAIGAMMRAGVFTNGHAVFTGIVLGYGVFLAAASFRWRQVLWKTRTNRHFLWTLWAAFVVRQPRRATPAAVGVRPGGGVTAGKQDHPAKIDESVLARKL